MVGQIALVGGDEFSTGCQSMDKLILQSTGTCHPKVLIVPTAAAEQNPYKAASKGKSYFNNLGAETGTLLVLDRENAGDPTFVSRIEEADLIYFTGGDPELLLNVLTGSKLFEAVKHAIAGGTVLAGSSAGAMVLGSWMNYQGWKSGLGLLENISIFPHHEKSDPRKVSVQLAESLPKGGTALGIDAGVACLGTGQDWKVVGNGSVILYADGTWNRYHTGESISVTAEIQT